MSGSRRLSDLVRERAETQPDRAALRQGERVLTYQELLGEVRARSEVLSRTGIPTGSPMAVRVSRNLDSVLAVLAVLDAGYAYIPIEAGWPADRGEYVLDNAGARAVIEPAPQGITVTELAGAGPALPSGTAYVLYTSGSSGRPKGVAVSHANVLSMLEATARLFTLGPDDVWTTFHSLCFDFSVWELWGALYCGGCAVVVEQREATSMQLLVDLVARNGVTVLSLVPSIFRRFADACAERSWPELPLRYVVFGGEAIDRAQCLRWMGEGGAGELINMYGITEATVHTTFKRLQESDLTAPLPYTPIGHPLPSLGVALLGSDCLPVPPGEIGEITISGDGVALQYVANPAENAARFVMLELYGEPRRYFRTGDLAIRDENGELYYVGRADTQVKVNGYRIELAEIEAALAGHPQVGSCVATTVSVAGGPAQLALVAAAAGQAVTATELRTHLLDRLPPYLVPGLVYVVDDLPLNDNGKIDRAASKARIESFIQSREMADAGN